MIILQESWVHSISQRLRNMRRKPRDAALGIVPPPRKRHKTAEARNHNMIQSSDAETLDQTTYERYLAKILKEWTRPVKPKARIDGLMNEC